MENVTRESVLKEALRLYFNKTLLPHMGYLIGLNPVDADDVDQDGREAFLQNTCAADYLSEDCVVCALGGMLYAFLQQKPQKTLREAWPFAVLEEKYSWEYAIDVCAGEGSDNHDNAAFVALEELFTRRELHCIERAFETTNCSVRDNHPLDAQDWHAAVTGWVETCGRKISNMDARYVQALANALRHGGSFDPYDFHMLSIPELEELCGYAE